MTKLLLVDLDGTCREPLSGAKFISHPKDQKIIQGADKALAHYHSKGWTIVGITNQGGVAAGHKQLEDAIKEQEYTLQLFPEIVAIYFCPDFDGRHCWLVPQGMESLPIHQSEWAAEFVGTFRKPGAGMLRAAIKNHGSIPLQDGFYIGDRPEDEGAALGAGINYLDAAIWRGRFLPGVNTFPGLTKEQIEFLEGVSF